MRFTIEIQVDADRQSDVRDLANGIQKAIRTTQRNGRYPAVTITEGPTVGTWQLLTPNTDGSFYLNAGVCTRGDHPVGTPCNGYPSATCAGFET